MRRKSVSTKMAVIFEVKTGEAWRVPIRLTRGKPFSTASPSGPPARPDDFVDPAIWKEQPPESRLTKERNEGL